MSSSPDNQQPPASVGSTDQQGQQQQPVVQPKSNASVADVLAPVALANAVAEVPGGTASSHLTALNDKANTTLHTAAPAKQDESSASASQASEEPIYEGLTFVSHMIAGAVAGTVEHCAMYPVDTIKTRMQALAQPGQRLHRLSVFEAISSAVRREGLGGLYRGVGAVAGSAGPAHALHFAVYEYVKDTLGGNVEGHSSLIPGFAAAVSTVVNDGIMTPADFIKQRLQLAHSPYSGVMDCVRKVYEQEGLSAFYRSYRTTLVMNVPFQAMHFGVYDAAKRLITGSEDADDDTLAVQLLAGGLAGGSAALITTPFDVVKTRLQTQGVHCTARHTSTAVLPAMKRIIAEEGTAALFRGWQPRVLFNAPSAAICWGTYETMKTLLTM